MFIDEVKKADFTCEHPNPILRLFKDVPVTFLQLHNRCDKMVRLFIRQQFPDKTIEISADIEPGKQHEMINCGEEITVRKWCTPEGDDDCAPAQTTMKFGSP
ncbi:MAG: hypothetical protein JJ900_00455 [Rhodospirillales bacterium]|nr:hypothetical protein [Rhodospirillales bacterium]MBO6785287.1 hypothetical protein [Rhodospirillales bacterium]